MEGLNMKNRYIDGLKYQKSHPFRTDAERMLDAFHTDTYIENGVIRWKSSQNVPPIDILEFWNYIGFDFDYKLSIEVAQKEIEEKINSYKKRNIGKSSETLYEMRAAFGEGVEVIDVLTGKSYKT